MTWKGCPKRGPSDIPNWTWFLASQIKTSITEYLILQGLGRCGCPTYDGWSVISFRQVIRDQAWFFACLRFDIACPVWENDQGWFHTVHYMVYAYLFHLGSSSFCHIMYIHPRLCMISGYEMDTPQMYISKCWRPKNFMKMVDSSAKLPFPGSLFWNIPELFSAHVYNIQCLHWDTVSFHIKSPPTHLMMTWDLEIFRDPQEKESHPWSHHSKWSNRNKQDVTEHCFPS